MPSMIHMCTIRCRVGSAAADTYITSGRFSFGYLSYSQRKLSWINFCGSTRTDQLVEARDSIAAAADNAYANLADEVQRT